MVSRMLVELSLEVLLASGCGAVGTFLFSVSRLDSRKELLINNQSNLSGLLSKRKLWMGFSQVEDSCGT